MQIPKQNVNPYPRTDKQTIKKTSQSPIPVEKQSLSNYPLHFPAKPYLPYLVSGLGNGEGEGVH